MWELGGLTFHGSLRLPKERSGSKRIHIWNIDLIAMSLTTFYFWFFMFHFIFYFCSFFYVDDRLLSNSIFSLLFSYPSSSLIIPTYSTELGCRMQDTGCRTLDMTEYCGIDLWKRYPYSCPLERFFFFFNWYRTTPLAPGKKEKKSPDSETS